MLSMYADSTSYPVYEDCIVPEINPRSAEAEITNFDKLDIYPNPSKSIINIDIDIKKDEYGTISIIDIRGNTIFKTGVDGYSCKLKVVIDSYLPGIYLVKYSISGGEDFNKKLIISK